MKNNNFYKILSGALFVLLLVSLAFTYNIIRREEFVSNMGDHGCMKPGQCMWNERVR